MLPSRAEALLDVGERRVAVAQLPVGVLRPARQLHGRGQQHGAERLVVARAGREAQLGGGGVGLLPGEQVVVDLHHDPAALAQADAVAGLGDRLLAARRPRADPRGPVDVLEAIEPGAAEAGPALVLLGRVLGLGGGDLPRRDLEQDHVVHDVGVAGQHLRAGEPGVLVELGVEQEAPVVVGAGAVGRGRRVRARHGDRRTRLPRAQRVGTSPARRSGRCAPAVPGLCGLLGVRRGRARRGVRGLGGRLVGVTGAVAAAAGGQGEEPGGEQGRERGAGAGRHGRRATWRLRPASRTCATSRRARGGGCGTPSARRPAPVLAMSR